MRIWKYPLPEAKQAIALPEGAKVVHVGLQYDEPTIWVKLDPERPFGSPRLFRVVATGQDFQGEYLGTAVISDTLVLHVIEQEVA